MNPDLVKRRHRELSAQQAKYVANRERGISRQQSAVMAGYADVDKAGEQVEESESVQIELQKARDSLVAATGTTRERIAEMMVEAFDLAKTMADAGSMVRAAAELGKLLGHYAPEIKKHQHEIGKETREVLARMTDAQLLQIAHGRVIEGEVVDVKAEPSTDQAG